MEPTPSEVLAFTTLHDVLTWAGFGAEDEDAAAGQLLLQVFGLKPTDHVRVVGSVPEQRFNQALLPWKVGDRAPSFAEASNGGLIVWQGLSHRVRSRRAG